MGFLNFGFLQALGAAFQVAGTLTGAYNSEKQLNTQEYNLRRQEAVAGSQGAQAAIEQDRKMTHILSAENVEAVSQGTTMASFSAMTLNNMSNFSEDRKNLNTNMRMKEDIFESEKDSVKTAKRELPFATALKAGAEVTGAAINTSLFDKTKSASVYSAGSSSNSQLDTVDQIYASVIGT